MAFLERTRHPLPPNRQEPPPEGLAAAPVTLQAPTAAAAGVIIEASGSNQPSAGHPNSTGDGLSEIMAFSITAQPVGEVHDSAPAPVGARSRGSDRQEQQPDLLAATPIPPQMPTAAAFGAPPAGTAVAASGARRVAPQQSPTTAAFGEPPAGTAVASFRAARRNQQPGEASRRERGTPPSRASSAAPQQSPTSAAALGEHAAVTPRQQRERSRSRRRQCRTQVGGSSSSGLNVWIVTRGEQVWQPVAPAASFSAQATSAWEFPWELGPRVAAAAASAVADQPAV